MDAQTIIVVLIVVVAVVYLARKYGRAAKTGDSCCSGCGGSCGAEKSSQCDCGDGK